MEDNKGEVFTFIEHGKPLKSEES